ncbi:MAG TPA: DUF4124 domain-containing protein [Burkholderiales bacterium]|nr:DUF4124 domain-containing protein [Burkholderiales bacterium]
MNRSLHRQALPGSLPFLLTLCLALGAVPAQAQIYKWKDANGVTHYDDRADGGPGHKAVKTAPVPISASSAPAAAAPGATDAAKKACDDELASIEAEVARHGQTKSTAEENAKFEQTMQERRDSRREQCSSPGASKAAAQKAPSLPKPLKQ